MQPTLLRAAMQWSLSCATHHLWCSGLSLARESLPSESCAGLSCWHPAVPVQQVRQASLTQLKSVVPQADTTEEAYQTVATAREAHEYQ
jgi:hypothetical protein